MEQKNDIGFGVVLLITLAFLVCIIGATELLEYLDYTPTQYK